MPTPDPILSIALRFLINHSNKKNEILSLIVVFVVHGIPLYQQAKKLNLSPLTSLTFSLSSDLLKHFADGLLCFNIRVNELDDYQGMMSDLEKAGKWSLFSKKTVPYFAAHDMPKETLAFVYKVLKN